VKLEKFSHKLISVGFIKLKDSFDVQTQHIDTEIDERQKSWFLLTSH
jgi:hypothetical protein